MYTRSGDVSLPRDYEDVDFFGPRGHRTNRSSHCRVHLLWVMLLSTLVLSNHMSISTSVQAFVGEIPGKTSKFAASCQSVIVKMGWLHGEMEMDRLSLSPVRVLLWVE